MNPAIVTEGLHKRFGKVEAVRHLDLSVPSGSIYAFIGPNGAGKTTTIKLLMNILAPSGGRAAVLGVDSRHLAPPALQRIGYVSENQELPGWMKIPQFLAYCRGFYPAWDAKLEQSLLSRFHLPGDTRLKNLSRGMRMKTALVSSIAYRPQLLILDEPFSGLDPVVRDEFIEAVLEVSAETEWAVFVSSHDLSEIESVASHIGYFDGGELRVSEELATLQARYREVEVTGPCPPPGRWPEGWSPPRTAGRLTRFVVSRYREDTLAPDVEAALPGCQLWEVRPMTLRAIFKSLAGKEDASV